MAGIERRLRTLETSLHCPSCGHVLTCPACTHAPVRPDPFTAALEQLWAREDDPDEAD